MLQKKPQRGRLELCQPCWPLWLTLCATQTNMTSKRLFKVNKKSRKKHFKMLKCFLVMRWYAPYVCFLIFLYITHIVYLIKIEVEMLSNMFALANHPSLRTWPHIWPWAITFSPTPANGIKADMWLKLNQLNSSKKQEWKQELPSSLFALEMEIRR